MQENVNTHHIITIQYNTIQYKTCNAPYVTRMLFVGAEIFAKFLQMKYRQMKYRIMNHINLLITSHPGFPGI